MITQNYYRTVTERIAIIIETKRLLKILSRKFQSKQAQWGNLIGHCDFAVFCLFMPLATSWWFQFELNRRL